MLDGAHLIRKKQKSVVAFKLVSLGCLLLIPLAINFLTKIHYKSWQITICVAALGGLALVLHRMQIVFQNDITRACHQLGPGVKLVKKFRKTETDQYQIFQEGHRYYYLQHLKTGEKRLVAKEKILQDYDLAL